MLRLRFKSSSHKKASSEIPARCGEKISEEAFNNIACQAGNLISHLSPYSGAGSSTFLA